MDLNSSSTLKRPSSENTQTDDCPVPVKKLSSPSQEYVHSNIIQTETSLSTTSLNKHLLGCQNLSQPSILDLEQNAAISQNLKSQELSQTSLQSSSQVQSFSEAQAQSLTQDQFGSQPPMYYHQGDSVSSMITQSQLSLHGSANNSLSQDASNAQSNLSSLNELADTAVNNCQSLQKSYNQSDNPDINYARIACVQHSISQPIGQKSYEGFSAPLTSSQSLPATVGHQIVGQLAENSVNRSIADTFLGIEDKLVQQLTSLELCPKVTHVSNPLKHAADPHKKFVQTYLKETKKVLFLGMNPGPWGMSQTGIPFGEVGMCKNWLNITGDVIPPADEHPKRPIQGFNCKREEVSGKRFWSLFEELCLTPNNFFKNCFVYNHCPLAYMGSTGKNITPPDMPVAYREINNINLLCDLALAEIIQLLQVKVVVGVGKFAEARAKDVIIKKDIKDVKVMSILHPSPMNPVANKGWAKVVKKSLEDLELMEIVKGLST